MAQRLEDAHVGQKFAMFGLDAFGDDGDTPLLEFLGDLGEGVRPRRIQHAQLGAAERSSGRRAAAVPLIATAGMTEPADIYAAARVSPRSGQLTLAALATAGLITRTGRTVAVGRVSLDDIAAAHHLDETQAERIARYRRERAAWHTWLALQDQLRGLAATADHDSPVSSPAPPVFADEADYLASVLAHGPPAAAEDDEYAAIELLADLLGARILTATAVAPR